MEGPGAGPLAALTAADLPREVWIVLAVLAAALLLWLSYLVQAPVRRRLFLRWRAARLAKKARRRREKARRLAAGEEEVLRAEAAGRARGLLASSWLREADDAPGIGPALIERLRASGVSGSLSAAKLRQVPGIGEAKAQALVEHLAAVERRYREHLAGDLRDGRLELPARAARKRTRLAARRVEMERIAAEFAAAERAARGDLAAAPVFRFRSFLVRLPRSLWTAPMAPIAPAGAPAREVAGPADEAALAIPPHPNARLFRELLARSPAGGAAVAPGRAAVLPVADLARTFGFAHWVRPTREQSARLARLADEAGFALEPDPRRSGRPYALADRVALFAAAAGPLDEVAYGAAALILRLGIAVAQADGAVAPAEIERITREIETAFELGERERERLEALEALLLAAGSDLAEVTRELTSKLAEAERARVGRFLVAVAAVEGAIAETEERILRLAFRRLGLPAGTLARVLEEAGASGLGEAVEAGANRSFQLELDMDAVQRILAESREVARLLHDAMSVPEDPADTGAPAAATATASGPGSAPAAGPPAGIPARYTAFCAACTARARWPRAEAEALARRHGHMLDGAIEAVNEWAFEAFGAPLLHDEGEEIAVDPRLAQAVPARESSREA